MDNLQYKEEWKKPFTNKRYLHPPFAENIFTMWPDLKVICGDVIEKTCGYISSGFRILVGENLDSPDFTEVKYNTRSDGAPIHSLSQDIGDYTIRMESFCNITRRPTSYTEFIIENNTDHQITETIALLPRTGREDHLVGTEVDGYAHYNSNVYNWGLLTSGWKREGDLLTDGEYSILMQMSENVTAEWQGDVNGLVWYKRNLLKLTVTIFPGERACIRCAFRHGEVAPFNYHEERAAALKFWNTELLRLKTVPGGELYHDLVNNLVMQCLQMLAYPVGKNYVLARQGGLQRVIWPCEAMEFLMALDRLGDFFDYTKTAYETYFFELQRKEGEDVGAVQNLTGNRWGSITGGSCWGCAYHLIHRNSKEAFDQFKEALYLAFGWMQEQRSKTMNGEYAGVGIFPPMKACDWPGEPQSWTLTDATNLMGYKYLAEAFEKFGDPRAAEIRAAYDDYMACMKKILADELAKNTREGEIFLTNKVGEEMTDPPTGAYMTDGPGMLVRVGVTEPGSEAMKLVENYFRNRGMFRNGLTGLMNDGLIFQGHNADPWAGHTWYTSFGDIYWFENWLKSGEREKAAQTMFAQMKWGMSSEFYLLERYADNDPYWTPWMPNASANGRLLMMMADYFGE